MADPILHIADLDVRHGRTQALSEVSIDVYEGEAVGLLGTNGAGKTTLLNTISGFLRPTAGSLALGGEPIHQCPPHVIVRRGLLQLSQERDLFGDLTVLDNLRLGSLARAPKTFERNVEKVFHYFPRLKERAGQRAATMSGGEQQMLAIGRALMAEPKVMLFDEPSAGLSPLFVQEIGAMMRNLRNEGEVSILLVEQNMLLAAQVVDRFYMLRAGRVVAEGSVSELEKDHEELARQYYL